MLSDKLKLACQDAAELLSDPGKWWKGGDLAQDANGNIVGCQDPKAIRW